MWVCYRDDIGISQTEHNGSLTRIFEQDVWIPESYDGKMPNGDAIKNGIKFIDIRTQYRDDPMFKELETYYNTNKETEGFDLNYHRFWHIGDYLMACGTMATLFPDAVPSKDYSLDTPIEKPNGDEATNGGGEVTTTPDETTTTTPGGKLLGDVNLDGKIDMNDLSMLALYILKESTPTAEAKANSDVDGDGDLTITDLSRIKQFVSHKIDKI